MRARPAVSRGRHPQRWPCAKPACEGDVLIDPALAGRVALSAARLPVVRGAGVALIAITGPVMIAAFLRFPAEGTGVPFRLIRRVRGRSSWAALTGRCATAALEAYRGQVPGW